MCGKGIYFVKNKLPILFCKIKAKQIVYGYCANKWIVFDKCAIQLIYVVLPLLYMTFTMQTMFFACLP